MKLAEQDSLVGRKPGRGVRVGSSVVRLVPMAIVLFLAVAGPWLAPYDPRSVVGPGSAAPSAEHWFGTDASGLDVFSRTLAAFQIDIVIASVVSVLCIFVALLLGLVAGMYSDRRGVLGIVARVINRSVDLMQAVPVMIGSLVLVSFFGRNPVVISMALIIVILPYPLRLMRTEVLKTRGDGFVDAARISGESEPNVLLRHVLPNSAEGTLRYSATVFGMAIIFCAALGFLGAGLPVPTPEWGSMLSLGAPDVAAGRWWPAFFPAAALAFSVWAASVAISALVNVMKKSAGS